MRNVNELVKYDLIKDIYYLKPYVALYLKEGESIFEFEYKKGDYVFYNIAIKRLINQISEKKINDKYYDLETAYGYGGVFCNTNNQDFISEALNQYEQECLNQNIIAEFVRFHPFNDFHKENYSYFDFIVNDRPTVYVDTTTNKDQRWSSYTSKLRTILRKCERELRVEKSENIKLFLDLYYKTMDRNNATNYYYFDNHYFEDLLKLKGVELYNVYKDDVVVSSSFFMFNSEFGHYHLSANNYEYRKYNANYFILDNIFDIAHKKGVKYFHLGGGRTNEEKDSLLVFKRKFSSLYKEFYIAGKVFDQDKYREYIKIWEELNPNNNIKYFLKYRMK